MKTDEIKDFLNTMSDSIKKDNIELFKKIIDSSGIKYFSNPNEFYFTVLLSWDKFISGFLNTVLKANDDLEFIFKNSKFIDRHFCNLFVKYEGSAFSSDKSRTIVNRLLEFYETGKIIEFEYNSEYTYNLPKKIFKSHNHIVYFYDSLKSLFLGNYEKYLKALKKCVIDND